MTEKHPLDRRVQRTRQLLQAALFHLIIARGYESITIQDITEEANLGRTTFYLHYRDKEYLLREGIKALLHSMQLDVEPDMEEPCTFQILCIRIFQHVERQQQLYQAMLKEAGPTNNFGDVMRTYFTELCQRFLPVKSAQLGCPAFANTAIFAAHASGSLFGLISWWLDHDVTPTAEQMGTFYYQLMSNANRLVFEQARDNLATMKQNEMA